MNKMKHGDKHDDQDDDDLDDDGDDDDDDEEDGDGCSPFYLRPFYLPSLLPTSSM